MRERILGYLTNVVTWYNQLQAFRVILPQNLINGADQAFNENIPHSINEILNLLNSVSGYNRFGRINNIQEAITLFENNVDELDEAFNLVPENRNIIGFTGGQNFSAEQLLENMRFWVNAHCDTINLTLTAGRITAGHRNT